MILARIVAPVARTAMMLKSRCNLARPLTSLLSQNCAMSPLSSNVAFIQNSSSPILPSTLARSIQTATITRDIDSATKFISAGACNVLRIADLPILISRRFFSSESEYEKILKELKFKYGSQPDPEIILRDLAVEIRAKDDAVKTATELKKDLETVKRDAAVLEFLLVSRKELEVVSKYAKNCPDHNKFTEEMQKIPQFSKIERKFLTGGKHFRNMLWILGTLDPLVSEQVEELRELLGRDPKKYIWFANQGQNLYDFFSSDVHEEGQLLDVKYLDKKLIPYYVSFLPKDLRKAMIVFWSTM